MVKTGNTRIDAILELFASLLTLFAVIKKLNKECDQQIGFYDTFKTENHILSMESRANGMISWIVKNLMSKGAKTRIRPHVDYCTQACAFVSRDRNWSSTFRLESIQRFGLV